MLKFKTDKLELRGIKHTTSAKGNIYYTIHAESPDGEPHSFYCKDSKAFPDGLKKGDSVVITLTYTRFKELEALSIERS